MSQVQAVRKNKHMWVALWPCLFLLLLINPKTGQSNLTRGMGITQNLGSSVPNDLPFKDEDGKSVKFGDMLHGKPVLLVPIFYRCQTGCVMLADNIIKTFAKATKGDILKPGRDLDVLMVSIDPQEDSALALSRKTQMMSSLSPKLKTAEETASWRKEAESNWHLLTGSPESVHALTQAIGLKYTYRQVPDLDARKTLTLINHPTCTVMLTPSGKISSYTIGNEFQTREVEHNVHVAMSGQIGRAADQSSMFGCIMADPAMGRNREVVEGIWRILGILTVLATIAFVVFLNIKTKRENLNSGGRLSLQ